VTVPVPVPAVAERLAAAVVAGYGRPLPETLRARAEELLIDVAGLAVAARGSDYVRAVLTACEDEGRCTAFGHVRPLAAADAALVNGTAAHGEDFDDTFEGGPVHAGAVVIPAVLAVAERDKLSGNDALYGIVVGAETMCRLSLVIPKAIHQAGFHPTAVLGALAAAVGVSAARRLPAGQLVDALGIAGSMASGIIEYLAEGAWTKRLHPGWAAQAGLRAARLAAGGFRGPRTVFEGTHGLFNGFAHSTAGDWGKLLNGFGQDWLAADIAFKPYACGTMIHPYIDCARRIATRGVSAGDIAEITCEAAEGTVHRLWEPLAAKRQPPNAYAAKFSTPFGIAVGLILGDAGLGAFTEQSVRDPRLLAVAAKVAYVVDPANPYPRAYTGHLRVRLNDGRVIEERQPHLRGGAQAPLGRAAIEAKFRGNTAYGGWPAARAESFLAFARAAFDGPIVLQPFRG
jgi:2-methylcitrate dehydratase PrpD